MEIVGEATNVNGSVTTVLQFSDDSINSTVRSALIYSDPEAVKAPESHARIQKQAEVRSLTS